MSRLPTALSESDRRVWGPILNDFLTVAHNADGTLKGSSTFDPRTNATNALTGGFGVAGNGTADDTAGVKAAIAAALASSANLWNGYHVLYFPAGTYKINQIATELSGISNLYLVGDGWKSVFKQADTVLLKFTTVTNLKITNLAFDMNNIAQFGGVQIYNATNVEISRNRFYDSSPRAVGTNDRYAMVFGVGTQTHKRIFVTENVIEDLQCEFDHMQGAYIAHNQSYRQPTSTGFGSFVLSSSNEILEDITYYDNLIVDPYLQAITMRLDGVFNNGTFRRIQIVNNRVIYNTNVNHAAIFVGAGNTVSATTGNIFEDIDVSGNVIEYRASAIAPGSDSAAIVFQARTISAFVFQRGFISNNTVLSNWKAAGSYAFDLNFLQNFSITRNNLQRLKYGMGINNSLSTIIKNNHVQASTAGSNAYFMDQDTSITFDLNTYSGTPVDILLQSNMTTSTVNAPTAVQQADLEVVPTANLPSAGAANDGRILIENVGTGDRNLIIYAGGQRFRIDGGAAV